MPRKGEREDLTGKRFNRLTVLNFERTSERRRQLWRCRCDCGNETIVDASKLRSGHTKSCGCYAKERIGSLNKKSGRTQTRIFYVYWNMVNRCGRATDKNYSSYGGRGIRVCDEWLGEHGFENFCKWAMESGYDENAPRGVCTLDRIDVNGNYEPSNCRWVTQKEQCNNRRVTRYVKINGKVGTVANLSREYKIDYCTLLNYSKGAENHKHKELKIEVADGL